jgi:3-oxoacyl-[acyl-carrier protein] reductase
VVTGASRGIGRAVCLRLARDGYEIVAIARNVTELDTLAAEIVAAGGRCRTIVLDLTDADAIAPALAGIDASVLVNNAAVGIIKPFVEMKPDEWTQMIALNINALFHVTQAVLPPMMSRGSGHICTIGSIGGRSAWVGGSCYGATKAFVTSWAESLMLEVRDQGVKVSVVMPGSVATHFGGKTPSASDAWKISADDVADAVASVVNTPPSVLIHRLEVRTLNVPPKR